MLDTLSTVERVDVNGLTESDSAAIIREVQEAFGEDMPAFCTRQQRIRYQLLDVASVRGELYAVRVLRIPLDGRGDAITAQATAPSFMLSHTGKEWELVGRRA